MSTEPSQFTSDKGRERKARSETHANRGETDRPSKFDEFTDRHLRQAIENKDVGLDGLQAARVMLVKLFGRIERMHQKIDAAFCGQPFLQELSPTCPANVRRFNTYFREHQKVTQLLGYALEMWSFACGLKREDDWVPVLIADMNRRDLQEALRQNPNQNAAASTRSVPEHKAQAPTETTERAPVTQIDIGRSGSSTADKNGAKKCGQGP